MARNRTWLRLKSVTTTCLCLGFAAGGCESRPAGMDQPSGDSSPHVVATSAVEAGRYLVIVAGCNDCHTDGYMTLGDAVPEEAWLSGSRLGWRGPWGTTYAANLRLRAQELSEDGWLTMLKTRKALPPHPWVNTNQLSEADARAMYQYIRSLGPVGEPMPASVPPDRAPSTAYLSMIPVEPPKE